MYGRPMHLFCQQHSRLCIDKEGDDIDYCQYHLFLHFPFSEETAGKVGCRYNDQIAGISINLGYAQYIARWIKNFQNVTCVVTRKHLLFT